MLDLKQINRHLEVNLKRPQSQFVPGFQNSDSQLAYYENAPIALDRASNILSAPGVNMYNHGLRMRSAHGNLAPHLGNQRRQSPLMRKDLSSFLGGDSLTPRDKEALAAALRMSVENSPSRNVIVSEFVSINYEDLENYGKMASPANEKVRFKSAAPSNRQQELEKAALSVKSRHQPKGSIGSKRKLSM